MKLIDNIKDFFFASEEDDDDEQVEMPAPARKSPVEMPSQREEVEEPVTTPPPVHESNNERPSGGNGRRNKVVNIQTTAQLQVVLVKPSAFTDAKQIADHLIAKKTVVLNLLKTRGE